MPTLRRSAKRAASPDLDVDDSTSRALEPVATNIESIHTNPEDGTVDAIGVVNDAKETTSLARKSDKQQDSDEKKKSVAPRTRSKLPTPLQFPLLVIISFSASSLCYSFLNEWTGRELANVAKSLDTWQEVGLLAGWRVLELALGWFGNLDSLDLAALNLLAHGPSIYLLSTFYNISAPTALAALGIEMLSTFAPFQLLRPLSGHHTPSAADVANREIVTDPQITIYTGLLSAIIYGITIFTSLHTYLPTSFVLYFQDIPSITPAHTASYLSLLPIILAFGFAAQSFIFVPFAATGASKDDRRWLQFDPVSATLGETVAFNLWGYTTRSKVIIFRTALAMLVTGVETYLQAFMTVRGVQSQGALAYAAAWVAASFLTGVSLALVGNES